jgi:hypothetical protein
MRCISNPDPVDLQQSVVHVIISKQPEITTREELTTQHHPESSRSNNPGKKES